MNTKQAETDTDQLRAELHQIQNDIAALTDSLRKFGAERGHEGMDAVKRAASATERQAKAAVQSVEDQVSERPLQSLLVAFGLGFVIGKLLDR